MSPNSDDDSSNNGGKDDEGFSYGQSSSAVQYTSARITKNAASLARRRRNNASSGGSGGAADGNGDAWFARKSVGWSDNAIKRHITGSSNTENKEGYGMVGDIIQGVDDIADRSTKSGDEMMKQRRKIGVKFAWEEEEESDNVFMLFGASTIPPKLSDIMDEHDEIYLMSPLQVRPEFGSSTNGNSNNNIPSAARSSSQQHQQRKTNAALDELALSTGTCFDGRAPIATFSNNQSSSIGRRILMTLGYRPRLGMAFVPIGDIGGKRKRKGGVGTTNVDDEDDSIDEHAHEKKWLAKNHLRAIALPSILSNNQDSQQSNNLMLNDVINTTTTVKEDGKTTKKAVTNTTSTLAIPPPKLDVHGIGYDPYKNAPEFREYNAKRLELARKRGRDLGTSSNNNEEGKYKTNVLKTKRRPWETSVNDDDSDNDDDNVAGNGDHQSSSQYQSQHYAVDRDYTDFVGTKDASGFAIDDDDDAHAYDHNDDDIDNHRKGGGDKYTTEIHSPVASDDENEENDMINDGGMLFGNESSSSKKQSTNEQLKNDDDVVSTADAWSAWGLEGANNATGGCETMTMDGKPLLSGFVLGRRDVFMSPKRWAGPLPPTGYVLKRHVVEKTYVTDDSNSAIIDRATDDATNDDYGLGMYLQSRRSTVPKVLPPSTTTGERQHTLNFHAVRESMKNRFVVSSAGRTNESSSVIAPSQVVTNDGNDKNNKQPNRDLDAIEFVESSITSWMPTRLLCKRWGVPVVPSISGVSNSGDGSSTNKQAKSTEEDYFRHTVYDPAMAGRNKKYDHAKTIATSTDNRASGKLNTRGVGVDSSTVDDDYDEEESNAMDPPPPTRPPADIFRSIFDTTAESDMDLSSSDDDNDDSRAIIGMLEDENSIPQITLESEKCGEVVKAMMSHNPDPTSDSDSGEVNRRKSRKRHYRDRGDRDYKKEWHDRHRRRRDSTRSYDDDRDEKRRKRKKHRSQKM